MKQPKKFRNFCTKLTYNEENTIEKIKQCIDFKTKFIGIYKLNDEMYIYVKLDNCQIRINQLEKKLENLGEILELSSFDSIGDDLEYISSEGELKDGRTKKESKKIEINAVGDEDYFGIYTSGLGESMEIIIQNKINEFKRLIEECENISVCHMEFQDVTCVPYTTLQLIKRPFISKQIIDHNVVKYTKHFQSFRLTLTFICRI